MYEARTTIARRTVRVAARKLGSGIGSLGYCLAYEGDVRAVPFCSSPNRTHSTARTKGLSVF